MFPGTMGITECNHIFRVAVQTPPVQMPQGFYTQVLQKNIPATILVTDILLSACKYTRWTGAFQLDGTYAKSLLNTLVHKLAPVSQAFGFDLASCTHPGPITLRSLDQSQALKPNVTSTLLSLEKLPWLDRCQVTPPSQGSFSRLKSVLMTFGCPA